MSLYHTSSCESCGNQKVPINICQCNSKFTLSYNTLPLKSKEVFVFVRITDSCRIETYILSSNDEKADEVWKELVNTGWKLSNQRKFSS